jgi:acetoacetate decarboxylase
LKVLSSTTFKITAARSTRHGPSVIQGLSRTDYRYSSRLTWNILIGRGQSTMAKVGRLKKEMFGFSMPVTSPAVQEPPFYYRNMEIMTVQYSTDADAALDMLPEDLELHEPARGVLVIAKYHFSTFGRYNEAILGIPCRWQGGAATYLTNLFVTQEAPLIAGREIWGYPKKLAEISLFSEHEAYMGTIERPRGNRIATAVMRTISNAPGDPLLSGPIISLKLIPNAEERKAPSVCELIACDFKVTPIIGSDGIAEVWTGPGSVVFDSPTEADAWFRLKVVSVISCNYGFYNGFLPHGRILKSYY